MSPTPRTDAAATIVTVYDQAGQPYEMLPFVSVDFARMLERGIAALRKELQEVTAAFQAECDHDFVTEDHSFSHEFGTEKIFVCRCSKCGKDAEPDDVPDPDDDGCDDGPRDPRELREIDP